MSVTVQTVSCTHDGCDWTFAGEPADCKHEQRAHDETHEQPEAPKVKTVAQMDAEADERAERTALTIRCIGDSSTDCDFVADGPAAESRIAWAEHRRDVHDDPSALVRLSRPPRPRKPWSSPVGKDMLEENVRAARLLGAGAGADATYGQPDPGERTPIDESEMLDEDRRPAASGRGRATKWSKDKVVEAIRAFHAEHGKLPSYSTAQKLAMAGRKQFGSWIAALEAAGIEDAPLPTQSATKTERYWTAEKICWAIRVYANAHDGEPPKFEEWNTAGEGRPSSATVTDVFGNWSNGIAAAGLEPRQIGGQPGNSNGASQNAKHAGLCKSCRENETTGTTRGPFAYLCVVCTEHARSELRVAKSTGKARPDRWLEVPGTRLLFRSVAEMHAAALSLSREGSPGGEMLSAKIAAAADRIAAEPVVPPSVDRALASAAQPEDAAPPVTSSEDALAGASLALQKARENLRAAEDIYFRLLTDMIVRWVDERIEDSR